MNSLTFTLTRRSFLDIASGVKPDVPSWSYLSSYDYGTPLLGTFHGSDILQVFFSILPNYASWSFHAYYLSFVNTLDPNNGTKSTYRKWPKWKDGKKLLSMYPAVSTLISDDFRGDTYQFILDNVGFFHI
jgi:hypothetical protein